MTEAIWWRGFLRRYATRPAGICSVGLKPTATVRDRYAI